VPGPPRSPESMLGAIPRQEPYACGVPPCQAFEAGTRLRERRLPVTWQHSAAASMH
jgi:hypothetical protein